MTIEPDISGPRSQDEVAFTAVDELRRAIDARELSVEEIVRTSIERSDLLNPILNALVARRSEAALAEAATADRVAPHERGPLHGIPFTVKDVTETLEMPTTHGSRAFEGVHTGYEAVIVTRLRAAGAILIGKTNTPELACEPVTRSDLFGETLNPWAADRTPGGSSGGAAAGLAAGMFTLAQGTDAGGSIRIPASCCGIVGCKPTRGRVSFAPASHMAWGGLLHSGPLARTVRDAALMLDVMADDGDRAPNPAERRRFRDACELPLGRLRVAYASDVPAHDVDADVAAAFQHGLRVLGELGLELVPDAPDVSAVPALFAPIAEVAFAGLAAEMSDEQLALIGPKCLQLIRHGWRISAGDYYATLEAAHRESARIHRFWDSYDVLVTPTVPWVPPLRDRFPSTEDYDAKWAQYGIWEHFTSPWNLTGQPAISVPCPTVGDGGLPSGLQLVGPVGGEARLFTLAAAYESASPWAQRRPPIR